MGSAPCTRRNAAITTANMYGAVSVAQWCYVEDLQIGDSGVLASKPNLPSLCVIEPNLSFYNNRIGQAAHTAETMLGHSGLETEYCQ